MYKIFYILKQRWANGYRYAKLFFCILLLLVIGNISQSALADNNQEINQIIRTREIALQALNNRDFSQIAPYLHPTFTITTVDNQVFHQVPEFEKYWNQQFNTTIKEIKMNLKGEPVRTFLSPQTVVSSGDAIATFYFQDGKAADMSMRWTAVLQKLQDKWTIQSLHFSSNLLDNPVLNAAQGLGRNLGIGAGIGGFLLGGLSMLLLTRSNTKKLSDSSNS